MNLRLFGTFNCELDGRSIALGTRTQQLLALTILEKSVAKSTLARMLWPDSSDRQARTNLRRELHLLQKALPATVNGVSHDRLQVSWQSPAATLVDLEQFNAIFSQYSDSSRVSQFKSGKLLLNIYTAPLLQDFSDKYLELHRGHFAGIYDDVAQAVARESLEQKNYVEALQTVKAWRALHPFNEMAILIEMQALQQTGRTTAAIDLYTTFCERLSAEFDCAPAEQLRHFAADLKSTPVVNEIIDCLPDVTIGGSSTNSFIGRTEEIQWLNDCLNKGAAPLILLSGEPGIGKSSLVDHWLKKVQAEFSIISIRCQYSEANSPFSALSQWLALPETGALKRHLSPVYQADIAHVFPEYFGAAITTDTSEAEAPPTQDSLRIRSRVFEALSTMIMALSEQTIIYIDDLHWADLDSLQWLLSWINRSSNRLSVVATMRLPEGEQHQTLRQHMLQLKSQGMCKERKLRPLTMRDRSSYTDIHLNHLPITRQQRQKLCVASGGNPLFLSELVDAAKNRPQHRAYSELPVFSDRIYAVIKQRTESLDVQQKLLVTTAAIAGKAIEASILAAMTDMNPEAACAQLESLVELNILTTGGDGYLFRHDCLREAFLSDISPARQQFLHQRIAIAYQSKDIVGPDIIAYHYDFAGQTNDAINWYERSILHAERRHAFHECLGFCDKAIDQLIEVDSQDIHLHQRARVLLVKARVAATLYGMASRLVDESCKALEPLFSQIKDDSLRLSTINRLRMFAMFSGNVEKATAYSRLMMDLTSETAPAQLRTEAQRSYGLSLLIQGRYSTARRVLKSAVAIGNDDPDQHDSPSNWSRLMSLFMLAHTSAVTGHASESRKSLHTAQQYSLYAFPMSNIVYLFFAKACALQYHQNRSAALTNVTEMNQYNESKSNLKLQCFAHAFGGWAEENPKVGVASIEHALQLYSEIGESHFIAHWHMLLSERLLDADLPDRATHCAKQGIQAGISKCGPYLNAELYRLAGRSTFAETQSLACANNHFDQAIKLAQKQSAHLFHLRAQYDRLSVNLKAGACPPSEWITQLRQFLKKLSRYGRCIELKESEDLLATLD